MAEYAPLFRPTLDPLGQYVEQLAQHLGVFAAAALCRHMEGMVGALEKVERCAIAELRDGRLEEPQLGEFVLGPLQEQHRDLYVREMLGPLDRGLAGRMEREAKKRQAAYAGQRLKGLCLRGHAAAERLAAADERQ